MTMDYKKSAKKLLQAFSRKLTSLRQGGSPQIPSACRRVNAIFVHVPKAAGSTINLSLYGYRLGHRSVESYWKADSAFTEQAFKFTFVRHPYFRFVSAYRYLLKGGMSTRDADYMSRYPGAFESLSTFAEACELQNFRNDILHLRPQSEFLSLPSNGRYKIFMDYVGKTEFLNDHIDVLQSFLPEVLGERLALAKDVHMNVSQREAPEIDKDIFQKIRRIYQDDFELFGYDEWGTREKAISLLGKSA